MTSCVSSFRIVSVSPDLCGFTRTISSSFWRRFSYSAIGFSKWCQESATVRRMSFFMDFDLFIVFRYNYYMRFITEENGDEWHIWEDSRVFVPKEWGIVTKHYRSGRFSIEDIRRYRLLHRILANKWLFPIEFDEGGRELHGLLSDKIWVRFLDVGDDISYDDWWVIHKVPKVQWDSLLWGHHSSFEGKIKIGSLFWKYIEIAVSEILGRELRIMEDLESLFGLRVPHVMWWNIKVTSHTETGIELCVTDIGGDIRWLLDQNRDAIDRLLSV
jgi:hypothetical protein